MFRSRMIFPRQFFLPKEREISNPLQRYEAQKRVKEGTQTRQEGGKDAQNCADRPFVIHRCVALAGNIPKLTLIHIGADLLTLCTCSDIFQGLTNLQISSGLNSPASILEPHPNCSLPVTVLAILEICALSVFADIARNERHGINRL